MATTFGTIIHATLRLEDLIPAFAEELEIQVKAAAPHLGALNPDHSQLVVDAAEWIKQNEDNGEDHEPFGRPHHFVDGDELLGELSDALNEYAPPYAYFGAHEGDGSDFGYWLNPDFQRDFRDSDGLEVSDTSEVPADYTGEVLHVNDHGNATLYEANAERAKLLGSDKHLREVWSVV